MSLVAAGALIAGPASQAWLTHVDLEDAVATTTPLRLGGLSWEPAAYVHAPSLEPYRALVRGTCPGERAPLELAICLSNLFAARFIHGSPSSEFFARSFDPVAVMKSHMGGEPGHCVSRSGILATALLSTGVPARVLQMRPSDATRGHTAIEVWDAKQGWLFFDPTYGGTVENASRARGASMLLVEGGHRWIQLGQQPGPAGNLDLVGRSAYGGDRAALLSGHLVYPEPWTYTRVGDKQALPVFNGQFLVVGPVTLDFLLRHWLLQATIVLAGLGSVVTLWRALRREARSRTASPAIDVRTLVEGAAPEPRLEA